MSRETEIIKERLDLAEVVGEYVKLQQTGRHFKANCPFHQEKTPSFIVSPDKGMWYCFGCSEGGDLFSFMEKIENIDFASALKLLAERAGVELKQSSPEATDRRQRMFDLLELTARFYHEILLNQPAGKKAMEYLEKRGMKRKTMEQFGIGYAPAAWDTLQNFLRSKGYGPKETQAAGMVGVSKNGKAYDRFRGRIVWPIHDTQGRVVAFGGRITPWHETGEEGKYVNSPETELYEKRRVVYNLHRAKKSLRGGQACLVVEGYMDVVMLAQAGIENVVASSGTAFTDEAIRQLSRFTGRLHFAFDADNAGAKAALLATERALAAGMRVATVVLPSGKDPADLVVDEPDKVEEMMNKPRTLVSVLLRQMKSSQDSGEKEARLDEVIPLVATVANPVVQGEMVQEIASTLRVPEEKVMGMLVNQGMTLKVQDVNEEKDGAEKKQREEAKAEQQALGLIIAFPEVRADMMKGLKKKYILDESRRALYNVLHGLAKSEKGWAGLSPEALVEKMPDELAAQAEGLRRWSEEYVSWSSITPSSEGARLVRNLQRRQFEAEIQRLQGELMQEGDDNKKKILDQIRQKLEQRPQVD